MRTYEVKIIAFMTVVIKAGDQSEAMEHTLDVISLGDLTLDEAHAQELKPEDIESHKRHCDRYISELE